ncbi:hypothetical protein [Sporolactobacillus spathodeae]|uniref:Lipid-binding transport protein (Tim44 family) n=1 Tax=Sporolactobacillus spathodeae TaxID=1465502 RepID=A0ABS2Q7Z4_9BACL|nr:hypothetical protein [Sporolactobacillus spathodeae]MBM7657906.1 putative lipid-binding transport protein (Tim44 family) [Sporolactobacillus spathodeae]
MKKLMAAFLALTLILTPAGNFLSAPQQQKADAKGYRTGVRSFHSTTRTGTNSFFKNKTIQRTERQATTRSFGNSFGGSFMRGMIFGGLSGLLFGSMFSHFGGFGMMAGFLINFLAILAIIALVRYLFVSFTGRRRAEDNDKWKR